MPTAVTLPEPLTADELDAAVTAYWHEAEFADWRIRGCWDPTVADPLHDEVPADVDLYEEWRLLVASHAAADLLASLDWGVPEPFAGANSA